MPSPKKRNKRVPRSIFWKLFFLLIATAISIMVLVILFFRAMFSGEQQDITRQNAETYAHYIIQDIGIPPDTIKALRIAEENNLIIHYESTEMVWSSKKDWEIVKDRWFNKLHDSSGWYKMYYMLNIPVEGGRFLFGIDFKSAPENHTVMISVLIFFIALVLTALYVSIRHVLQPLRWLSSGVNKVASGDFDQQVKIRQMDQLGQLTNSFNDMTRKIKEMINARNQLLLDVSHEMRSPLTRLKVAMEFIPENETKKSIGEDIDELEYMLTEILETERMNSQHQKLNLVKTDLIKIIKDVVVKYSNTKPGLIIKNLPKTCFVAGDAERLKICLRNVIENSIKYSAKNKSAIEIQVKIDDKMNLIMIKDFGRGIPEEDLPYIFEPFYRVDKSRSKKTGGYGLGMSLCKKIIEAHNGQIEIQSKIKEGTTVKLTLPLY